MPGSGSKLFDYSNVPLRNEAGRVFDSKETLRYRSGTRIFGEAGRASEIPFVAFEI